MARERGIGVGLDWLGLRLGWLGLGWIIIGWVLFGYIMFCWVVLGGPNTHTTNKAATNR